MNQLLKYLDWVHKFATGIALLTFIMGFIGFLMKLPMDSAWFGLCTIMFGITLVAYVALFIMMVINAFKK